MNKKELPHYNSLLINFTSLKLIDIKLDVLFRSQIRIGYKINKK
jgi:hypothetical protein